jgi:signal transduction histidine kinase
MTLSDPSQDKSGLAFNYSYVVLVILLLISCGTTIAYYQNSNIFADDSGMRWTPVVFLIGLCISLVIFGMTHREAAARLRLEQRTRELIEMQRQNQSLFMAEQESRLAAERANLAKDEFLAVVSHELKTPLNAIGGWTRILRLGGVSDETRDNALEKIDKNLRIQTAIVDELLNFSDIMTTDRSVIKTSINIRDAFEDAVSAVSVAAFQKGVTLVNKDELDGERVIGDYHRLKIAIESILANAVKFTPVGGSVEARAFASDGVIKCVVSDNGLGIAPDFLPRIFEAYRQSEGATTRSYSGLGLGLTIAYHVIELHNGSLEAESSGVGAGSKFTISIPAAR